MRDVATGRGYLRASADPWDAWARPARRRSGAGDARGPSPRAGRRLPLPARPAPWRADPRAAEVPSGPNCWKLSVLPAPARSRSEILPRGRPPLITQRRIIISVLLAACAVALIYGASIGRPADKPVVYTDPAVKTLSPQPGDVALRQTADRGHAGVGLHAGPGDVTGDADQRHRASLRTRSRSTRASTSTATPRGRARRSPPCHPGATASRS